MSRFVELLEAVDQAFSYPYLIKLGKNMLQKLNAQAGLIDMEFQYFMEKHAPITKVKNVMNYQVRLSCELKHNQSILITKVMVPITTLCPCSKEISANGAHNQRAHVTVTYNAKEFIHFEEIIRCVESQASCELYSLLKRADEKYVTERAYNSPKFVEDIVRDIAKNLYCDKRISDFKVESENFESIHNHSAYAFIESPSTNK